MRGEKQHREGLGGGVATKNATELDAGHSWEVPVEHEEVTAVSTGDFESLFAAAHGVYDESNGFEHGRNDVTHVVVVVNHEDTGRGRSGGHGTQATGGRGGRGGQGDRWGGIAPQDTGYPFELERTGGTKGDASGLREADEAFPVTAFKGERAALVATVDAASGRCGSPSLAGGADLEDDEHPFAVCHPFFRGDRELLLALMEGLCEVNEGVKVKH
jgi:hypothetical protein